MCVCVFERGRDWCNKSVCLHVCRACACLEAHYSSWCANVADLKHMNSMFVCVLDIAQEVPISVISGCSWILGNVSGQPDVASMDADLCERHCWWDFKMFWAIYDFSFILCPVRFSTSVKCQRFWDTSAIVRQTFPVSYGWPPLWAFCAAGEDLGEDEEEGGKKKTHRRPAVGVAGHQAKIRLDGCKMEKILKMRMKPVPSCLDFLNISSLWQNGSLSIFKLSVFSFLCIGPSYQSSHFLFVTFGHQFLRRMTPLPVSWMVETLTVDQSDCWTEKLANESLTY